MKNIEGMRFKIYQNIFLFNDFARLYKGGIDVHKISLLIVRNLFANLTQISTLQLYNLP